MQSVNRRIFRIDVGIENRMANDSSSLNALTGAAGYIVTSADGWHLDCSRQASECAAWSDRRKSSRIGPGPRIRESRSAR